MFLSIGMLKQKYFLTDIFILSAEKQPIKLSWRKIEWLQEYIHVITWDGGDVPANFVSLATRISLPVLQVSVRNR